MALARCAGARKPALDAEGHVQWPVLFIYPQSMETDAVEAFHELHAFADHLDVMFGPEVRSCLSSLRNVMA